MSPTRPFVVRLEDQRRALSKPAFETRNGTTKFKAQRTHVAAVACPPAITDPWLMRVSTIPTTIAIPIVRRRLRGCVENASASLMAPPRRATGGSSREGEPVEAGRAEETPGIPTA